MRSQYNYGAHVKFVVYLIVIVLVNVAGVTLFFRVDLTKNKMYSISPASQKVVTTLSEPLTINVFFTKNLPAPYNNTERYLRDLLEEYAVHANRYFNYRFYNVSPEAEGVSMSESAKENQELANNYGIRPVQIQAIEKDEVKFKKAYMGLVILHGDMMERIPTISSIDGLEYRLTMAIQKLNNKISALLGLTGKIKVKLIMSSSIEKVAPMMGLNALPEYPKALEKIIGALNEKNYNRLEYTLIDPSTDTSQAAALQKYNVMRLKWPAFPDRNIKAGNGMIGMIMEYGEQVREIPVLSVIRLPLIGTQYELTDVGALEEEINSNLETLIDINDNLGYLADHGTLNIVNPMMMGRQQPGALRNFSAVVSQNYTLKPVNLSEGTIPESLKCLVIARPTQPFSDYELYQIDQALMRGTNLAIFLDAFKEEQQKPQQSFNPTPGPNLVPIDTGLEKLLNHYGVRITKSIVLDKNCHRQRLPQNMGGGDLPIYFVPIIKAQNINQELAFMKPIKGLVTLKMSPVTLDESRISEQNIEAYRLFSSSKESWEMRDRLHLNPMLLDPPPSDKDMKRYPLAYLLKGEFTSYFTGKPMPEKPVEKKAPEAGGDDKKEGAESTEKKPDTRTSVDLSKIEQKGSFISKSRSGQIFVMASSDMLKDNLLDPDGKNPNTMFLLNSLDTLNDRQDIAVMRSKEQRFNPLLETSAFAKTFIKAFNIAGLPVLVVLFGLFVWMRRHSRKKQIQMMFQK